MPEDFPGLGSPAAMNCFYRVREDIYQLHKDCPKPGCQNNPYFYKELEYDSMHGRLIAIRVMMALRCHNIEQQCRHATSSTMPSQDGFRMLNDMRRFIAGFKKICKLADKPTLHLLDYAKSHYGCALVTRYPPPKDPANRQSVFCKACMREQVGPLVNYPWCSHLICWQCVSASPMSAPPSGLCLLCYSFNPVIRIPHDMEIGQTSAPGLPLQLCAEVLTDIQYVQMKTNRPPGPPQQTPPCLNGSSQRYRLQFDPLSPQDVRDHKADFPEWWQYPKAEAGTLMQPKTIRKRLEYYTLYSINSSFAFEG